MKTSIINTIIAGLFLIATSAYAVGGKNTYESTCAACHDSGGLGAPKLGDKTAWAPRIATGVGALQVSALKGKGVMPPKGGNAGLSDADVIAAVDFMLAQTK